MGDDPGGRGTEIVRELRACEPCAAKAAAIERPGALPPVSRILEL